MTPKLVPKHLRVQVVTRSNSTSLVDRVMAAAISLGRVLVSLRREEMMAQPTGKNRGFRV